MLPSCPSFLAEMFCLHAGFSPAGSLHPKIHTLEAHRLAHSLSWRRRRRCDSCGVETQGATGWDTYKAGGQFRSATWALPGFILNCLPPTPHLRLMEMSSAMPCHWEANPAACETSPKLFSVYSPHLLLSQGLCIIRLIQGLCVKTTLRILPTKYLQLSV